MANIVTVQETHSNRKGRILMPRQFVVFEAIRKAKCGGSKGKAYRRVQ